MARDHRYRYRQSWGRPRGRFEQARWPPGEERDRYSTGGERRYQPAWEEEGYEGSRSYAGGGYPEEFGYREADDEEGYRAGEGPGQRWRSYDERIEGAYGPEDAWHHADPVYRHDAFRGGPWSRLDEPYWLDTRGSFVSGFSPGADSPRPIDYLGPGGDMAEWMHPSDRYEGQPSFRGRGPKGYRRSDERLQEIICERLTEDPYIDPSDVTVSVKDQVVTLTGTVEDRRTKYRIEDVIEDCGGIQDIDNQLRLRGSAARSPTAETEFTEARRAGKRNERSGGRATK